MRFIDISRPLSSATRVYAGDPKVTVRTHALRPARVTMLCCSAHAGTHMDAPNHLPGGRGGVETLPLAAMIGEALVVRATRRALGPLDLRRLGADAPPRLLFAGAPVLSAATARALVARSVVLVGTDGLSIDPIGSRALPAHRILLAGGVVILEGLRLARVRPGAWHLIALPLLIPGSDGAPARAVLHSPPTSSGRRPARRRRR